ncbi:MAG TPA: YjgN family protein [Thermodesulfobacteriota bacterium]|nr:YjgN family protein [Thermodesulfobacteriota bacterium]
MIGVKCPKCGLMQLSREFCESCGKKLDPPRGIVYSRRGAAAASPPPAPAPPAETFRAPASERPNAAFDNARLLDHGDRLRLSFRGTGGELFGIFLLNTLLTIVTLGYYYFWGKVKVRGYIWSKTEFEGDSFVYHGTGKELLRGFTKVTLLFGIPLMVLNTLPRAFHADPVVTGAANLISAFLIVLVRPLAVVGGVRYRLSRTSWRGIFFSFRGRQAEFLKIYFFGMFLAVITLGFYYPTFAVRRREFMVRNSYFGTKGFHFDGKGRELFREYWRALLLCVPTLGVYYFWFKAKKERFFWEHTSFEGLHFRSTMTGGGLLRLWALNLVLVVSTAGMALPWVTVRNLRYTISSLVVEGLLDPATISQEAEDSSAAGEFLDGFMDTGFDVG